MRNDISEKELKALISLLEDDDEQIVLHVEEKLHTLGTAIISDLEKEWMNNHLVPKVRSKIEKLIHSLQYELLIEQLKDWKTTRSDNLLEGVMLVAKYQYPNLNLAFLERRFEQYYDTACKAFGEEYEPLDQIKILHKVFYKQLKFRPNTKNFHAPSNSMINVVLESKRGNPLTLCIVYMLIAQRLKMPIFGVNLPNLFIVKYQQTDVNYYINVFNNGILFDRDDLDNYIDQLNITKHERYYQPCTNTEIIARCLRNLASAFDKIGEYKKGKDIKSLLQAIEEEH